MSEANNMSKEAMKLALEALRKSMQGNLVFDEAMEAFKALEEALTKQEQGEPVAGVVMREGNPTLLRDRDIKPTDKRLYTTPYVPTGRQQRPSRSDMTWEGLSVFEINDLVENTEYEDYSDLVERTEALLQEKNT